MIKSLKAKLISTIVTIAGVASVFAFAITSFAWFYKYTTVTGKNMKLKTVVLDTNINLDLENFLIYGKDDKNTAAFVTKDLSLRTYDLLAGSSSEEDSNIFNKRFYRIHIDYPNRDINKKTLSIKLTLRKDNNGAIMPLYKKTTSETNIATYISNVVQFKVLDNNTDNPIATLNDEMSNIETIYSQCVEALKDKETKVFVNNDVKSEFIEFSLTLNDGEESTDLIIEADYNKILMEKFFNSYKTAEQEGKEYIIANPDEVGTFEKDIEAIYFDLK